jgi:glycosyltransferase involved in cell wall biosynthesis
MSKPKITIIIATFNSEKLLPKVLTSIRKQSYPQNKIEILIVDGGSSDNTRVIAKKFGCRIINNVNVEPLYAKYLGYIQARGKYIMYLDHDEVIENNDSILRKVKVFLQNNQIKAVIGSGYKNPINHYIINWYTNEFGDPFSFFIYRLSKRSDFFLNTMRRRYTISKETTEYVLFDLSKVIQLPIIELVAGGSMIDGTFYKKTFPNILSQYQLLPHLLYLLLPKYPYFALMKNDALIHYSSDNLGSYIQKIIWRVKNNVFFTDTIGASGFSGRENYQSIISRLKRFLFIPYALSIILPLFDAIYLSMTRKNIMYIIHVPLTVMTAFFILYYRLLKYMGIRPSLTSYDGSTVAYEKK